MGRSEGEDRKEQREYLKALKNDSKLTERKQVKAEETECRVCVRITQRRPMWLELEKQMEMGDQAAG